MAKTKEKEIVLELRRSGLSIDVISRTTGISKSTVSYWCKNVFLTKRQIQFLQAQMKTKGTAALLKYAEEKRKDRIKRTEISMAEGERSVGKFSNRDFFITGLSLYWGEGYKNLNGETGFTNSDPNVIKLIIKWFKKFYGVQNNDFILRVSINNIHKNRVGYVINFWSKITKVNKKQFTKTSLVKAIQKKKWKNFNNHFGTLRVKVRRGTDIKRRILGSIQSIVKQVM